MAVVNSQYEDILSYSTTVPPSQTEGDSYNIPNVKSDDSLIGDGVIEGHCSGGMPELPVVITP